MGRLILTLIVAAIAIAGWGCDESSRGAEGAQTRPASTAPATQPAAGQLLLLEDDEPAGTNAKPLADNSRCHVCHVNFEKEELSLRHAKANVGCAKCHGASDAHIADESWASGGNGTAPEIMYPRDKINAACMKCHETNFDREKHKEFLAAPPPQKACTDCHGKHRMASRKCKWK